MTPNSFCRGKLKLNAKFDADSLLYSPSHFECEGHTVHMLTHWSTTLTASYSEVVTVHTCTFQSIPLGCQVTSMSPNCFRYINTGWAFWGQIYRRKYLQTHISNKLAAYGNECKCQHVHVCHRSRLEQLFLGLDLTVRLLP